VGVLNVAPPVGVPGVAGVSPDLIADPKQRAAYAAAINANREKNERNNQQSGARKLQKLYAIQLGCAIADAYRMAPVTKEDLERLEKSLRTYVTDEKLRNELFDAAKTASTAAKW